MNRLSNLKFMNTDRTRMPVRKRLRSRGVPTALQDHEILCTANLEEATDAVSAMLGPATLVVARGAMPDFQTTLNAIRFLDVSLAYLDFRAPTTVVVEHTADVFAVHMTTHVEASVVLGGREQEISTFFPMVTNPGDSFMQQLGADCPQLIVRIERPAVERQLSRMLGRGLDRPVLFEDVADLTSDEAVRWHGAIQLLSAELVSPHSLIQLGVGASSLEELIISTLLYIHPSNYYDQVRGTREHRERTAVHKSIEFIERHLAERISLGHLAEHAGVSVRSIQAGFREDLDTTPVAYIRDRRLDKTRAALMEAFPSDGITVGQVAERWGFTNPGTFAIRYRERFGEPPSHTLRR